MGDKLNNKMNKTPHREPFKMKGEDWQKMLDKANQARALTESVLLREYLDMSKKQIVEAIVSGSIKKRKDYVYDKDGFIKTVFEKDKKSILDELSGIYTFIEEFETYLNILINDPEQIRRDQVDGYVTIED